MFVGTWDGVCLCAIYVLFPWHRNIAQDIMDAISYPRLEALPYNGLEIEEPKEIHELRDGLQGGACF